ncbi:MAG: PAAR domain-containing protein [Pseudomonadota bacterium]
MLSAVFCAMALGVQAQTPGPGEPGGPGCALNGSPNVFIEGASMLRLGDVQGCAGLRWEIIPGVFINGQPAVKVLPQEECPSIGGGAVGVTIDGAPAARQGDAGC